jgi:hypothetical protein
MSNQENKSDGELDQVEFMTKYPNGHSKFTIQKWNELKAADPTVEERFNGYSDWALSMIRDQVVMQNFAIEDVEFFGDLVVGWYEQRKHDLKHMLAVPEGTEIELTEATEETPAETLVLDGDKLRAFRLGVESAMAILGELPFGRVVIGVDPGAPEGDQTVTSEVSNDKPG